VTDKQTSDNKSFKSKKRYYRKHVDFFRLLNKIKLWPSRQGILHGIKTITVLGNTAEITTHCNEIFVITNCVTNGFLALAITVAFLNGNFVNIQPPILRNIPVLTFPTQ